LFGDRIETPLARPGVAHVDYGKTGTMLARITSRTCLRPSQVLRTERHLRGLRLAMRLNVSSTCLALRYRITEMRPSIGVRPGPTAAGW